jgi:hypothetical protein
MADFQKSIVSTLTPTQVQQLATFFRVAPGAIG